MLNNCGITCDWPLCQKERDAWWEDETNVPNHYSESCIRFLTNHWKQQRKQSRTELPIYTFTDIFGSMPFLSIWIVIAVGLFVTSAAFFSFTGSRDVSYEPSSPQMWTASDSTVVNGSKPFPLLRQLYIWKNSWFGAVSTNGSKSDLTYAVSHVCWKENENRHLETCHVANRKGKLSNILNSFRVKLRVWKFFDASYFYIQLYSKGRTIFENTWHILAVCCGGFCPPSSVKRFRHVSQ